MKTRLSLKLATFSTVLIIFFLSGQGFASAGSQGLKLLEELEQAFVSLADKVRPAVVSLSPYVPPSPSHSAKNGVMPLGQLLLFVEQLLKNNITKIEYEQ